MIPRSNPAHFPDKGVALNTAFRFIAGPVVLAALALPGCGSGGVVPGPVDAVIAQMPPDSWKELLATPMADVCPTPTDNYACGAVMIAWSGGAYDSLRDRLVVFGGGHNDSWFNNVFTFDLTSMTWKRWTEMSNGLTGDTVPEIFRDKRIESCGLYPGGATLTIPDAWLTATGYLMQGKCDDPSIVKQLDPQQPRSVHSYGSVAFSTVTGRFYNLGSVGLFPSGQSGTSRVMGYDFTTGAWVRSAGNPRSAYGSSATDAAGRIWYVSQTNLLQYDPGLDAWTVEPSSATEWLCAGSRHRHEAQRACRHQRWYGAHHLCARQGRGSPNGRDRDRVLADVGWQ